MAEGLVEPRKKQKVWIRNEDGATANFGATAPMWDLLDEQMHRQAFSVLETSIRS